MRACPARHSGQPSAGAVTLIAPSERDRRRAIFRNCRFVGWQDTVLLNRGRLYFEDSLVAGHIDFIFGGATAWFERCRLHCWRNGYITAASTPPESRFGFVFAHGTITGEAGVRTYLGRPWRAFAQVAFVDTAMSDVVRDAGWHNWDRPEREKTSRFSESASRGPGGGRSGRVPWVHQMSPDEARAISVDGVLAGSDGWDPRAVAAHPSAAHALDVALPRPPGS